MPSFERSSTPCPVRTYRYNSLAPRGFCKKTPVVRRAWAADRAKEGMRTPTEGNADLMGDRSARRRRYQFFGSGWVERLCFVILPRLLFLLYLGFAIMGLAQTSTKECVGPDFVAFWAASSLALKGRPRDVYVQATQWAAEKAAVHNDELGYTGWFYPPP